MSSILDHKANFSANEERVPRSRAERIRTMGYVEPRTFSDSTYPYSATETKRKTRFQKDYVGIAPGDSLAKERLTGRDPPSHQNIKYEDDNVRFLATGARKRPSSDYDRVPRMFELSTQRIQRLNVFPDGTPRSGFPADISQEQLMQTQLGAAVTDLTTILKQGIPQQGALSEDDFKKLLANQFQSPGLQGMVFNQEQHKKVAEAEAKQRADEIKQLLEEGNVSRGKLIEEFRTLQEQGDISNEQLKYLTELTSQLANEKDDTIRKQITADLKAQIDGSISSKRAERIQRDLDEIQQRLVPKFEELADNKSINGIPAELDQKDVFQIGAPLNIDNPLTWIELMKIQSANVGPSSFQFKDPADVARSIDALAKGKWSTGIGSDIKNRERLALFGILNLINKNRGDLPSYEQIVLIEKLSRDKNYKGFAAANRAQLFADFEDDVDKKIIKASPAMMTPAKPTLSPTTPIRKAKPKTGGK